MYRPITKRFFTYALILTLVGSLYSILVPAVRPLYALHENVTINISSDPVTKTYEPGDSFAVIGTIDEVEQTEDVTIKFKDPSGSTKKDQDVTPDEDDGYFDYVYDILSTADEGPWTVEAEYSNDKMYTYFIVDDVEDTIIVVLDNDDGIYGAGDEVEISGQVDNQDDAEENVVITVLDPTNEPIVDEEDVELGVGSGVDDDEFKFSFDLDNAAPHGRYAVIVTYDIDDQEGSTLFEIEDEDTGSGGSSGNGDSDSEGDLSAEIEEATYAPGDTVSLSGSIDGYDSTDNEELVIVVEDPDGEVVDDYGDDDANVQSDGDFDYDIDLENDAAEGTYTVIIAYATDEVQMEFEVEEEGGSTGSSELTAKLNKSTYLAGETMTVSGTVAEVADPDEGEQVSIFLYTPDGEVILKAGSSKYVTPSSNGAYSATISIPSDLDEDKDYIVIVGYLDDQLEVTFDITGVSSTPSDKITVETDGDEYDIRSTVEISGAVPDNMIVEGQKAFLSVEKPDGSPCRTDQIDIQSSGSFSYSIPLGGNCGVAGEYEVIITYNGNKGSASFELTGSSASKYNLNVEGKSYPLEYELTGGTINSITVPKDQNDQPIPKLVIRLSAEDDGRLTLELPREVIDAVEDGEDIDYVVTIEDEAGNIITVDIEENNSGNARTLVIDYPAGAERIEITGTQVVPEFGTIAAIVLAVAIVGIIVATARYNKFSLFRQ
jgi:predicted secreted protein with PEFG-CTERM motif